MKMIHLLNLIIFSLVTLNLTALSKEKQHQDSCNDYKKQSSNILSLHDLHQFKSWISQKKEPKWSFKKRSMSLLLLLLGLTITIYLSTQIYATWKDSKYHNHFLQAHQADEEQMIRIAENQQQALYEHLQNQERNNTERLQQLNEQIRINQQELSQQVEQLSQRLETAIIQNTQTITQQQQQFERESLIRRQDINLLRNNFETFLREFNQAMRSIEHDEQTVRNAQSWIDNLIPSGLSASTIGGGLTLVGGIVNLSQQLTGTSGGHHGTGGITPPTMQGNVGYRII